MAIIPPQQNPKEFFPKNIHFWDIIIMYYYIAIITYYYKFIITCYYVIMTSLLHSYYVIMTSLLHHHYIIITNSLLQIITSLLGHHYIIITPLLLIIANLLLHIISQWHWLPKILWGNPQFKIFLWNSGETVDWEENVLFSSILRKQRLLPARYLVQRWQVCNASVLCDHSIYSNTNSKKSPIQWQNGAKA